MSSKRSSYHDPTASSRQDAGDTKVTAPWCGAVVSPSCKTRATWWRATREVPQVSESQ